MSDADSAGLDYGRLPFNATSFEALALLLSRDAVYGTVPLVRIQHVHWALRHGLILAGARDGRLVAACGWKHIPTEAALRTIRQGGGLDVKPFTSEGPEVFLTFLVADHSSLLRPLLHQVRELHRGSLILYERHEAGSPHQGRLGWFDRKGSIRGAEVGVGAGGAVH